MVYILDNTLINLISKLPAISVDLDVSNRYDEQMKVDITSGFYYNKEEMLTIDNQFTIIFVLFVEEVKSGHKTSRRIEVGDAVIIDNGGNLSMTFYQKKLIEDTLHKLVVIKNPLF